GALTGGQGRMAHGVPEELDCCPNLVGKNRQKTTGQCHEQEPTRDVPMRKLLTTILLLSALLPFPLCSDAAADTNWPQYRGPHSRGVSSQPNLPDRWSAKENVAWKCEIPGRGWSSPIVWKDRVFLTTVINSGKSEE